MDLLIRSGPAPIALETTLLVHGLPRDAARVLAPRLSALARARGATPVVTGLLDGAAICGLSDPELERLLAEPNVAKANTANLGVILHRRQAGATTVSTTVELASRAGIQIVATGGIGGVHRDLASRPDISADLAALARYPVAVVASGVKSILDIPATRELLETLGVPVVGFGSSAFPAFYVRDSGETVDARFDDVPDLARFISAELARTGRGILVTNPVPEGDALAPEVFAGWQAQARRAAQAAGATGPGVTPATLAELHKISGGKTLQTNMSLVKCNVDLAAQLAVALRTPRCG